MSVVDSRVLSNHNLAMSKSNSPQGLVLFHGAGGDKNHSTLIALEQGLDLAVARHNFPYRDKNPGKPAGPNAMPTLVKTVVAAVEQAAANLGVPTSQIAVGGRSLGGRAASVAVSEGLEVAGLLLLSYPLHPPGKPERLRTEHFGRISCPILVIQGKSDPFGKPEEIEKHFAIFGRKSTLKAVIGAHQPKDQDKLIVEATQSWMGSL